jgi:hypothetical protein
MTATEYNEEPLAGFLLFCNAASLDNPGPARL